MESRRNSNSALQLGEDQVNMIAAQPSTNNAQVIFDKQSVQRPVQSS